MSARALFFSGALALALGTVLTMTTPAVAQETPVKVYVMMGQSNMVGSGTVSGNTDGTLEYAVNTEGQYQYLSDGQGGWSTRTDVRNVRVMGSGTGAMGVHNNEWMTVPGTSKIGPEFGIGHYLGEALDEPVMILKSAIGNRSLGWDLLPPGSSQYEVGGYTYAGYGDSPDRWVTGTTPEPIGWRAGLQYDGDIANTKSVLSNLSTYFPGATEYEVAGFFWWQGDKDRYNDVYAARYEQNLVQMIDQLRVEFNAPNAKFVSATLGQTALGATGNDGLILDAQLAVDGDSGNYSLLKGNVATVYSNPLSLGGASNSHYNNNAKTYMNVGEAMGQAMVDLIENSPYVEVNRQTGEVKIIVPGTGAGDLDLKDYSFSSSAGALDVVDWDSITGNYDGSGNTSVDSGNWSVLTGTAHEFGEAADPGGSDGLIASGAEVSLGLGAWIQNPIEDLEFFYTDVGDLERALTVRYIGDRAALGDLDFDGLITSSDWGMFITNAQADMSGLSLAQAAQAGDLDADGDNDIDDFALFRMAYEQGNPAPGAFQAMITAASVPEPGSLWLLVVGTLVGLGRRRCGRRI